MSIPRTLLSLTALLLCTLFASDARAQEELPIQQPTYDESGLEPPLDEPPTEPNLDDFAATQGPAAPALDAPPTTVPASKLFAGGGVAILGTISASSQLALGFHAGAALFSIGLAIHYDPGGLVTGNGRSLDTLGLQLTGSFAYMAYNRHPLAFGPEIALASSIAPGPAFSSFTELQPGLALWYAPFKAPVMIGTALQLKLSFTQGADPVIETLYPGLRLRWGF
jgi:hypothetical protein